MRARPRAFFALSGMWTLKFDLLSSLWLTLTIFTVACIPQEHDLYDEDGFSAPTQPNLHPAQSPWPERGAAEHGAAEHGVAEHGADKRSLEEPNHDSIEATPIKNSLNQQLSDWYGQYKNYNTVVKDVKSFYPALRYNGCVAFMSAALRRLGVTIPIASHDPESPSLVTRPFSRFLEKQHGWMRIHTASALAAGDVVFTRDNPSYPGYPAHVYMFHSWSNKAFGIARVIDNQDFMHERNIYDNDVGFNFTPFAYALRAP